MEITLEINRTNYTMDVEPEMPLLWAIRDYAKLMGTKFGCGVAQCGSCTILMDGMPIRSCVMPVSACIGRSIVTIEGLSEDNSHPVQKAWIETQAPQCGYCQSGQIMNAVALLERNPNPTDEEIDRAMDGVLCRCGTYPRIRNAIKLASK